MDFFTNLSPSLIAVFFVPIVLVGVWLFICWGASIASGWRNLANLYATPRTPSGKNFRFVYGKIGYINYNGVLVIHVDREGIYLETFVLFSFRHPPLFLPWSRIREVGSQKTWIFQSFILEIFGNNAESICSIQLPESIFQEFKTYLHKT